MSSLRLAFAKVWAETSTFSPVRTTLDDFRALGLYRGPEVLAGCHGVAELGGFMAEVAETRPGDVLLPLLHANGWTGGVVAAEAFDFIKESLLSGLERAGRVDGFYFALHGSMVPEGVADVSGHLLAAVRARLGPGIPLVASFDHHGNVTEQIIANLDGLVSYHHTPHVDMFDTGRRAARLLLSVLAGQVRPVLAWQKIPLVSPSTAFATERPPLADLFAQARVAETCPRVLEASIFPVFPHMDVPELGWSTVVVTDGDPKLARSLCDDLAAQAWALREAMFPPTASAEEAVSRALAADEGPTVLVDAADNVNGGAPGDNTSLLAALLRAAPSRPAYVHIVDPAAVTAALAAGVGGVVNLSVGGKLDAVFSRPVAVKGRVARVADGRFTFGGHLGGAANMGRTVLLEVGQLWLVLSERIGPGHDPAVYAHVGLAPRAAQIIVAKCTAGFWSGYGSFMNGHIFVDCPGTMASDLSRLSWRHVPRPLYPLDPELDWRPAPEPRPQRSQ